MAVSLNNTAKRTPVEWAEHNSKTIAEGCKTFDELLRSMVAYEIMRQKVDVDMRVNCYTAILEDFKVDPQLEE